MFWPWRGIGKYSKAGSATTKKSTHHFCLIRQSKFVQMKEVKQLWTYLLFPLRVHPLEISRVLAYQCYWWSLASEHHKYQMHSAQNTSYHLQHWNQPGLKPHPHCHCHSHSHSHWQQWWFRPHHLSHLLLLCLCQCEDQQGPTVCQHIERGQMIWSHLLLRQPEMC